MDNLADVFLKGRDGEILIELIKRVK